MGEVRTLSQEKGPKVENQKSTWTSNETTLGAGKFLQDVLDRERCLLICVIFAWHLNERD